MVGGMGSSAPQAWGVWVGRGGIVIIVQRRALVHRDPRLVPKLGDLLLQREPSLLGNPQVGRDMGLGARSG